MKRSIEISALMEPDSPSRVGPVVWRECGYCDGDGAVLRDEGRMACPNCDGSGRCPVECHPFVTLEALVEHLGSLANAFGVVKRPKNPKIGTPAYHLNAAEEYAASLFQQLLVMLPEEYERTERPSEADLARTEAVLRAGLKQFQDETGWLKEST